MGPHGAGLGLRPLVVDAARAADLGERGGGRREWLETNGRGGYAMGTVAGPATRRYHALLCVATRPPVGRVVLVNALEEELELGGDGRARVALSAHFYPGVVHPDGHRRLVEVRRDPWPVWVYALDGGARLEREVLMVRGRDLTIVRWRLVGGAGASARLRLRPLLSGRADHALQGENDVVRARPVAVEAGRVTFAPYDALPPVTLWSSSGGAFEARPDWYRRFEYPVELARGLPYQEDLLCPGELVLGFDARGEATLVISAEEPARGRPDADALSDEEAARRAALTDGIDDELTARLTRAADAFIVKRGERRSIIAGYPWFTDWGRDAFISLGALGRDRALAGDVLAAFAAHVVDGLVPNRFPDGGEPPEYNAADAPLWFVLAACRYARRGGDPQLVRDALVPAIRAVVDAYLGGTRFHIGVDDDGLVHAGEPGYALTWMDAKVGDWVVTPRRGKPVEIQALWVAALEEAARLFVASEELTAMREAAELAERAAWARSSFQSAFWDEGRGWLVDVVASPRRDPTLRPNQLYALGLCAPLVPRAEAERALAAVERWLLTPMGLRTRAPLTVDGAPDPAYRGRYGGDPWARDGAYHEGTAWPFLLGIYADACARVRGAVPPTILDGLRAHLEGDGFGQLAEVTDGDAPHAPGGCPAQAWSVCEALRIARGEVGEDA